MLNLKWDGERCNNLRPFSLYYIQTNTHTIMTTGDYNDFQKELDGFTFEQTTSTYDDYAQNQVSVWGSQSALEELMEDLNDSYPELELTKRDIQEVGSECMLTIYVIEDF